MDATQVTHALTGQIHIYTTSSNRKVCLLGTEGNTDLIWKVIYTNTNNYHPSLQSVLISDPQTKLKWHSCPLLGRGIFQAELIKRRSGCEERKLTGKKIKRQEPSQCKCLLPFLTGTASHQLQHKTSSGLPTWRDQQCQQQTTTILGTHLASNNLEA